MMREAAIDVLKEKVLVGERKRKDDTDDRSTNKRRRTGSGNAAVDTEFGATGLTTLSSSERRDLRHNKQAQEKCEKDLKTEKVFIEMNLAMVQERKKQTEAVKRTERELRERTCQQQETGVQPQQPTVTGLPGDHQLQGQTLTEAPLSGSGNEDTEIMVSDVAEFWECRENSTQKYMVLFLHMYHPTCGVLSKSKVLLWKAIEEKVLHVMSEAPFVAKIEASRRRLDDIECQLEDLNTSVTTTEDNIT
jgi:hypothetical protein